MNELVLESSVTPKNGGKAAGLKSAKKTLSKNNSHTEASLRSMVASAMPEKNYASNPKRDITPTLSSVRSANDLISTTTPVNRRVKRDDSQEKSVQKSGLYKQLHQKLKESSDIGNNSQSSLRLKSEADKNEVRGLSPRVPAVSKSNKQEHRPELRSDTHIRNLTTLNSPNSQSLSNLKLVKYRTETERSENLSTTSKTPTHQPRKTSITPLSKGGNAKHDSKKKEESDDKLSFQPSKNSDFFFQMTYFKPIEDEKLDEFIQLVNEPKTRTAANAKEIINFTSPRVDAKKLSITPKNTRSANPNGPSTSEYKSSKTPNEKPTKSTVSSSRTIDRRESGQGDRGLQKSVSPTRMSSISLTKTGLASRVEPRDLDQRSASITTETYSRLDKLLQELKSNMDKMSDYMDNVDESEKGLFAESDNNSETSSTSYSVNKSFAKTLMAFNSGNL
jgi:hypothetical protein